MSRHNNCTGDGCGWCSLYDSGERSEAWWLAIGGKTKRRADRSKPNVPKGCKECNQVPPASPVNTVTQIRRQLGRELKWAYGVTTVPARRNDLLPRTLLSLSEGGFDEPRLFVDGGNDDNDWTRMMLPRSHRNTSIRTFGNWMLSLWELYLREPSADRYAIFQDDTVCVRNLRGYLDSIDYPTRGYLNLYTFPQNEELANGRTGFYESNQMGRGAVALVFDKHALKTILSSPVMVDRVESIVKGHRSVDGGVVTAMSRAGFKEYVHYPSLVQHVGMQSTMGNPPHLQSLSFPGEQFDAMELLKNGVTA